MKLSLPLAAAAAALAFAATVQASATPGITKHDRNVIRFFQHHPRLAATPAGGRALAHLLPRVVSDLRRLQAVRDRRLLAARRAAAVPVIAHELLWKCIAGYPGFRPGGGPGESGGDPGASNGSHFNILQMTDPWEGINPIGLPPGEIMVVAEHAYAASGYSHTWLVGQWGQTIAPCWQYA